MYALNSKLPALDRPKFWLIFHIVLGVISTQTKYVLVVWFFYALIQGVYGFFQAKDKEKKVYYLTALMVYLSAFELLSRMAETAPFLPYELGKYILFALLSIGIISFSNRKFTPWLLVLLLIPALFIDLSTQVSGKDMMISIFGTINMALAAVFFSNKRLHFQYFKNILYLLFLPAMSALSYVVLKTPSFDEIDFTRQANFATSGGFGPNQVSAIMGLGVFLSFAAWLFGFKFSGYKTGDALIMVAFIFQGLLTFSRGGMIGGFIAIFILLFYMFKTDKSFLAQMRIPKVQKFIIPAVLLLGVGIYTANEITDGNLLLRYQGETGSVREGTKEKDLNTLTTNRYDIAMGDLELFSDHPVLGVGVGAARYLRPGIDMIPHVEMTRLMAEHGILGLLFFVILIIFGFKRIGRHKIPIIRGVLMACFILAIYSSFHNATRTFITPLFVGLSMLMIVMQEPQNFKKQLIAS